MSAQTLPTEDDWRRYAVCRPGGGFHPSVWFPPDGPGKEPAEAKAKAICRQCPSIAGCLKFALATREDEGIWGGTNGKERRRIAGRKRRRVAGDR